MFATDSKINPKKDIAVISIQELRDIRGKTEKGGQHDAIVIKHDDLKRIKENTIYKSPEKLIEEKRMKETTQQASMAKSTMRKNKMKELDKARESKLPPSELTLEQ